MILKARLALETAKNFHKETVVKVVLISYMTDKMSPEWESAIREFVGDFGFDEIEYYRKFNEAGLCAGVYDFEFYCCLTEAGEMETYATTLVGKVRLNDDM